MASLMDQLVGHKTQKDWLLEQANGGTLPSSLIFQGPQGVGKKHLALALLQVMNCSNRPEQGKGPTDSSLRSEGQACGQCSSCRRVMDEQNEFVFHLVPEGKKTIGVDQIRETHSFLTLKSLRAARFVIVDPADQLSVPAANSLLKVLEESPEKTYFILITEKMRGLLPTIRSRSHTLKFDSLSNEELVAFKSFDALSLQWSDGRLQMALDLEDEKNVEQLNKSLKLLYSLLCEHPQEWKKTAPWFFDSNEAREFSFNIWKQALYKRLHNQGENLDWLPENAGAISQVYETVEFLKGDVQANVDKVLAVENFYYKLRSMELYQ